MAPRSVGSATISFGLVSIPVKLYKATDESEAIKFNYLHDSCGSRIAQKYFCATENCEVSHDHLMLGYPLPDGQYVAFTKEEVKAIEEKATHALTIEEFVPLAAVDPVYFEKTFFLAPEKTAARGYTLLAHVMEKTGKAALGKYASRGKGYLVLIRAVGGRLVMQQLFWANEVRAADDLTIPGAAVSPQEVEMAKALMATITSDEFEPAKYTDEVRERMLAMIEQRIGGETIAAAEPTAPAPQVVDLAAMLAASIGAAKKAAPVAVAKAAVAPDSKPALAIVPPVEAKPKGKGKGKGAQA